MMVMRSLVGLIAILLVFVGISDATERPNFVWLVSEDNSKHFLKLFDPHGAETPHIAALAREGILFEHAFANAPVCSVARTTLITGCYAPRIGTQYHRKVRAVPMPEGVRMFPAYLRAAGYYTSNRRKKDYNAMEGPGVWDESSNRASWRQRPSGQPFFHMQSFGVTHESSLHFPAAAWRQQPTQTDPNSVFLSPKHPDTSLFRYTYAHYHDRIRRMDDQVGNVIEQLRHDGLLDDTFVFYFGDHGGVLPGSKGYLYEVGLHVPLVVRVPKKWRHLVDLPQGARQSGFVSFVDFGPTLLHLAGLEVPAGMDGQPFLGKGIAQNAIGQRDEVFGYADRFDEKYDLVRSLRKGRYKYLRNYQSFHPDGLQNNYRYKMLAYQQWREQFQAGKLNPVQQAFFQPRPAEELYDVVADPYETKNLAGDPDYANTLADLRQRLVQRVKSLPDLSVYPESMLVQQAFGNPVAFGQTHQEEISKLFDIADLALMPFANARSNLEAAFQSKDPWQRYWGLIVCSAHGEAAKGMLAQARTLAAQDPELLVRTRAVEFLALVGGVDPRPVLQEVLAQTRDPVEALLILNTVVLLRDRRKNIPFSITSQDLKGLTPKQQQDGQVQRRLAYLAQP